MGFDVFDQAGRRKYLNASEGKQFMESAAELVEQRILFCQMLFYTGCRISEALAITPASIDWADRNVRIRTLKQRDHRKFRRLPLPDGYLQQLAQIVRQDDEPIWKFSRTTAWRIVTNAMTQAQIIGPQASPKGLRHGFGVRCAMAKIPMHVIQKWMGHSKPETTAIYLSVRDDEERELMSRTWDL